MARLGVRLIRTFKDGASSIFSLFVTPGATFMFTDVYAEDGSAALVDISLYAVPSATTWTIWFNEKPGQDTAGLFTVSGGSNDYGSFPHTVQILQDCAGDGVGTVIAEISPTSLVEGGMFPQFFPNSIPIDPFPSCAPPVTPEFWTAFVNTYEIP